MQKKYEGKKSIIAWEIRIEGQKGKTRYQFSGTRLYSCWKASNKFFLFFLPNLPWYEIQTDRDRRQSGKIKLRKIKCRQKVIVGLINVDFVASAKPSVSLILFSLLLL